MEIEIGERVRKGVFSAIEEVNLLRTSDEQLEKKTDQVLVGDDGGVDSLGLINLIVAVEGQILEYCGATISLTDEMTMSVIDTPFKTIGTLMTYIAQVLKEKADE